MVGGLYRPSLKSWLFAQAGVFMLWLPWLIPLFIQSTGVYREFWVPYPTWQTVADTLKAFLSAMLPAKGWLATGIWIAFGSLIMLGVWRLRQTPSVLKLLLVIFLTPLIGEWVAGMWRPIFDDRTLIWITLPLYLCLAVGIVQLRYRPVMVAAVLMLTTISLLSVRTYFIDFAKEEMGQGGRLRRRERRAERHTALQRHLGAASVRLLLPTLRPTGYEARRAGGSVRSRHPRTQNGRKRSTAACVS